MGLISFHGDENLKKLAIASKDSILDPKTLEESFGIPSWVCHIKPLFFNIFKKDEGDKFELDLLRAIPIGVNLEPVKWKFFSYMLSECIDMLRKQTGNESFLKEKNAIMPLLEKTKGLYEAFYIHRCEDEASYDFDLISRTLRASLPRCLEEKEYHEIHMEYSKKLIKFFKKESNVLFFDFKGIKKEKEQDVSIDFNEKSPLMTRKKTFIFKYLKSLVKGMV
jgi:hypothetical protein